MKLNELRILGSGHSAKVFLDGKEIHPRGIQVSFHAEKITTATILLDIITDDNEIDTQASVRILPYQAELLKQLGWKAPEE